MEEIALAREHEAVTVSLGRRTLRSETAAIAAVAQLMPILER
jgi:RsmE family RNA methyltransferase